MWSLTIIAPTGHSATTHVLLFGDEDRGRAALDGFRGAIAKLDDADGPAGETLVLRDDFGTELDLPAAVLDETTVVFQDVKRSLEGCVKRALLQHEAQAKENRQAQVGNGIMPVGGAAPFRM